MEQSTDASQDDDESSLNAENPEHQESEQFLFSESGQFFFHWNNFIILLALYDAVLIPLQIFYKDALHSKLRGDAIGLIDAFVEFFFLMDIIIIFRTAYLDPKLGIEVRDPHKIAINYIRGPLLTDLISSVPFNVILASSKGAFADFLNALGLLKLLRLHRLFLTVQHSNLAQDIKVYLKVMMMAFLIMVLIHLFSCIWFAIVRVDQRWVQNMDFMFVF